MRPLKGTENPTRPQHRLDTSHPVPCFYTLMLVLALFLGLVREMWNCPSCSSWQAGSMPRLPIPGQPPLVEPLRASLLSSICSDSLSVLDVVIDHSIFPH